MNIRTLYCPTCGNNIEYDVDSDRKRFYCNNCGAPVFVDYEEAQAEYERQSRQISRPIKTQDYNYHNSSSSGFGEAASGCALASLTAIILIVGTIGTIIMFIILLVVAGVSSCSSMLSDILVISSSIY